MNSRALLKHLDLLFSFIYIKIQEFKSFFYNEKANKFEQNNKIATKMKKKLKYDKSEYFDISKQTSF